jgi:hypothetical protein
MPFIPNAVGFSGIKHTLAFGGVVVSGSNFEGPFPVGLIKAMEAARSARFEHGESGAT